jgi:hypothetical protein
MDIFTSTTVRSIFTGLLMAGLAMGQVATAAAKPKFFICPKGLERDATVITEQYDVNLCSRTVQQGSIDSTTYLTVAMRHRITKKQINLPLTTDDDIIYIARSRAGVTYKFDFNRRLLTIQPLKGKVNTEKIIASD